jgi:hypothetical protein
VYSGMDLITYISFLIFGMYVVSRLYFRRAKVLSSMPWWAGDPVHFGVGAFITRLPVEWAWLVSVMYVVYQVFDWRVNGSDPAKDVGVFLAGLVTGLGYDVVRF